MQATLLYLPKSMAKMGPLAFTLFVLTLTLFVFMASSSWGVVGIGNA